MENEKICMASERDTLKANKRTTKIAASHTSDEIHAAGSAQESISSDASTYHVRKKCLTVRYVQTFAVCASAPLKRMKEQDENG